MGDLHGNFDGFARILRYAGLVGPYGEWIATGTHLVQLGDVVGRGGEPGRIYNLLKRLQEEAPAHDSRVHVLLGNHEAMSIHGFTTYNTPEEFRDFTRRENLDRFPAGGPPADPDPVDAFARAFGGAIPDWIPVGMQEFQASMAPEGRVGRWLCAQNSAVRINDTLFVHGGLGGEFGYLPLETLNANVREEILRQSSLDEQERHGLLLSDNGPHWNRDYTLRCTPDKVRELGGVLDFHRCARMVVGHTPTFFIDRGRKGHILPLHEGKVICVDTGIGKAYGQHLSALLIERDRMVPIYP